MNKAYSITKNDLEAYSRYLRYIDFKNYNVQDELIRKYDNIRDFAFTIGFKWKF